MNINNSDLENWQQVGRLGLCADPTANEAYPTQSYITTLFDQGIIPDPIISFALRNEYSTSYADVGFYDENVMFDPSALTWIPSISDEADGSFYWQNLVQGIRFRTTPSSDLSYDDSVSSARAFNTGEDSMYGIIGTNSMFLTLPISLYMFVTSYLED